MAAPQSVLQEVYRISLVLNNNGVKCLESGAFPQALLSLEDSLRALRMLVGTVPLQDNANDLPTCNNHHEGLCSNNASDVLAGIRASLQRAVSRMARITLQRSQDNTVTTLPEPNTARIIVHIISTGDYDKPTAGLHQGHPDTIYAVRFDDIDSCTGGTVGGFGDNNSCAEFLEMNVAAVLLNLALVRYCMTLTTANGHVQAPVATELAVMSQDILGRLSNRFVEGDLLLLQHRSICLNYTLVKSFLVILKAFRRLQHIIIAENKIQELEANLEYLHSALVYLSPWCEVCHVIATEAA